MERAHYSDIFPKGEEIIPFGDISGGICDEAGGAEMVGDEVPDLEGRNRRGDGLVGIGVDVDDASSCRGGTLEDEGSGRTFSFSLSLMDKEGLQKVQIVR